ncbi:hypothetical protein AMECASPLE_037281 [Ameca splendens]|uniref:Uncharacterized protein n=1 Tax=Ameca splendens TaxID=208324 RepID=A0ABV0XL13_9TELE
MLGTIKTFNTNRSLFLGNWFKHGILLVQQLFSPDVVLMSSSELEEFGIPKPPKEQALIFDAILSGVIKLLKSSRTSVVTSLYLDPADTRKGQICSSTKKKRSNHDERFQM